MPPAGPGSFREAPSRAFRAFEDCGSLRPVTIFNRRNALLGWLTWNATKKYAERKARSTAGVESKRSKRALVLGAVAAAGTVLFFWRRKGDEELPPPAE
jgi:hypothetical protein